MKLFELFNRPAEFDWVSKSSNYGNAMFVTADVTYKVLIGSYSFDQTRVWTVQFEALTMDADKWTIANTKTGNELEVFSTVIAVLKEFMSEFGVRSIHIQTFDRQRASLYPKMLKRLLPQWQIHMDGGQLFALKPGDPVPSSDDEDDEDYGDRP